jgi:SM-20-related protein
MKAKNLAQIQLLQTNPRLVVWPGDALTWMLLGTAGEAGAPFHLPTAAVAVLHAFCHPHAIEEVFHAPTDEIRAALGICLEGGLLIQVAEEGERGLPSGYAERWAGFLFRDHQQIRAPEARAGLLTRKHILSEKAILVLDDCIDPSWVQGAHRWFFQLPYRRIDSDTRETTYCRHWVNTLTPADHHVTAVPLFHRLAAIAVEASGQCSADLRRIDAYSTCYGDLPLFHRDLESGRGLTAVFYGNAVWDDSWMSETVFCDDHGEPTILVPPRPGRLLIFDSALLHRAGTPSRDCHETRYTLVFKFALPS